MLRAITIVWSVAVGLAFGRWLSFAILADILQPIIVGLSIMAAALLVRLNRGMPTLDWKSLDAEERKLLTEKVVGLTREYMTVLFLQAGTLVALLALVASKGATRAGPSIEQPAELTARNLVPAILFVVGALIAFCVARMGYIIWRDYDIVRLQKKLIDDAADRETVEKASQDALNKVTAIRSSGRGQARRLSQPPGRPTRAMNVFEFITPDEIDDLPDDDSQAAFVTFVRIAQRRLGERLSTLDGQDEIGWRRH